MGFKDYMKGQQAPPSDVRRILPFILVIFLIFGFLHYFIFRVATRSVILPEVTYTVSFVLFAGLLSMPAGFLVTRMKSHSLMLLTWYGYIWMGLFTFLFFFALVESLISLVYPHPYSFWILIASAVIGLWSLYQGVSRPKVIRHSLAKKEFAGLKLVQISDLHVGMLHLNRRWLSGIVDTINSLKPDIVAVTGDLVEGAFSDVSPQLDVLAGLSPRYDKFYITGNHEYIHHSGEKRLWERRLEQLGFTTLHNENKVLSYHGYKLLIAGVPDRMVNRFVKSQFSLPDQALKSAEPVDYKILLAHEPSSVFDVKSESCDLVLTGHTHGGQIFPFHLLVKLAQPVVAGFKRINNILVFAHQGTGFWGPPMRWFSRSEIVVFEWR